MQTTEAGRPPLIVRLSVVVLLSLLIWLLWDWLWVDITDGWPRPIARIANALVTAVLVVSMVLAARRYLDRRPGPGLHLAALRDSWRPFLVGALAWLIPTTVGAALAVALGWVQIAIDVSIPLLVGTALFIAAVVFLSEAFPEELIFRGYLYRNLVAAIPPWAAAVVQATVFTFFGAVLWTISNGPAAAAEQAQVFLVMGLALGAIRVIVGNVWACIGYHLVFQVVAQMIFGTRHEAASIRGEDALILVAFLPAFVLGPLVAAVLTRNDVSWTQRELDLSVGEHGRAG